jgi:hypothetical protein
MSPPERPAMPKILPEFFALNSIQVAFGSADKQIDAFEFDLSVTQRMALLEEMIFFHHFMAFAAVFIVIPDTESQRSFGERMMGAINSGTSLPTLESLGLSSVRHFSNEDQYAAIRSCFFSVANLKASMMQDLYLGRQPSESELGVMSLNAVRKTTSWDTRSASVAQYFAAALLARLSIALKVTPPDRLIEFTNLAFYAVAESRATFDLYIGLLGLGVTTGGSGNPPTKVPATQGNWLSRLFK